MTTERIVLRAFGGDEGAAEELLSRGFAPGLMETREGREVAQAMLELRSAAALPTLANLRQALAQKGSLPARLRRYLVQLEMTPRCSRLHAVAHLQLLKLDAAMDRADHLCHAITTQGGGEGGIVKPGEGQAAGGSGVRERIGTDARAQAIAGVRGDRSGLVGRRAHRALQPLGAVATDRAGGREVGA